jgi:hypothetical protein
MSFRPNAIMHKDHPTTRLFRFPRRIARAATVALGVAAWPVSALAYRPFDGTDAAVADPGEFEIEFQPAGVQHEPGQTSLVAPATVLNFGFAKDWEAVLQGRAETPLSPSGAGSFSDAGLFLKHVLRDGSLQEQSGPSIATEFGVLLPGINADAGIGVSVAGIVSQRWEWTTVHFNVQAALTRDQHADTFVGTIIEGPSKWAVRPVAEIFYEDEFGVAQTISGLVGAIWQVNDKLSFDVGLRHAFTNGRPVNEVRAGLTVGFPTGLFANRK